MDSRKSNVIGLSVGDATVRVNRRDKWQAASAHVVKIIPNRSWFYPKREQETGKKREKGIKR